MSRIFVRIIFVDDSCLLKHAVSNNNMLFNVTLGFAFESKTFSSTSNRVLVCVCSYCVHRMFSSVTVLEWHYRDQLWQVDDTWQCRQFLCIHQIGWYYTNSHCHSVQWENFVRFVDIRMMWVQTLKLSGGIMLANSYHLFEFHKLQTNRLNKLSGFYPVSN